MTRKLRLYAVFSVVLVALSACGRNFFSAEREPWRREAEVACLKSGAVKEGPERVRITPIEGPGMCGADFPLKVSALGESRVLGYSDEPRPPAQIPGSPRWPVGEPRAAGSSSYDYEPSPPTRYDGSAYPSGRSVPPRDTPLQIAPAQSAPAVGRYGRPPASLPPGSRRPSVFDRPDPLPQEDEDEDRLAAPGPMERQREAYPPAQPVPLGTRPMTSTAIGPVEVSPAATLACPIVSALDRWMMDAVQPASLRWFGQPVVEIKQISAYSCRGMNGQRNARISEHAFGNALDIAAFVLADGRRITVRDGWRGNPEEQGFLHDVQGAACEQFSTVLAPGSNAFHYDHIHVDLMRRASGRVICQPGAIPGEVVAARARAGGNSYARRGDRLITGSVGKTDTKKSGRKSAGTWRPLEEEDESIMEELDEPRGGPGED
ncbi:MAG TPA: extensin family protein [Pseudorhodoplanes sp.]|jgi:hypothetical protein|nr:extensin family protein [Pseudorhodoplanes sp.]